MSELLNSITFNKKTEIDLFHKQIDLLLTLNRRLRSEDWETQSIQMMINDDGEYITLSWCQHYDGESIQFVDPYHYLQRDGSVGEFLDIDSEAKYTIPIGEFYHTYDISGEELINFIQEKRSKESKKLEKEIKKHS